MSDARNAMIPGRLMATVEEAALAQSRSVEEVLTNAVQSYLDGQLLEESVAFGETHARSRGLTPADVAPAIVKARSRKL